MTNAPRKPRVSQAEVTKALRAARAAGHSVARVEIEPTGRIIVFMGEPGQAPTTPSIDAEFDRILERRR